MNGVDTTLKLGDGVGRGAGTAQRLGGGFVEDVAVVFVDDTDELCR